MHISLILTMVHGRSINTTGDLNVRPPIQTPMYDAGDAPDPSVGGLGYGYHTRNSMVVMMEHSIQQGDSMLASIPHNNAQVPSESTLRRWKRKNDQEGNVIPKRHTGNVVSERQVKGIPLILLAIYRTLFPKAQRCEVQAFLFRAHSGHVDNPFLYSKTEITAAEADLGLSFKKGSTTAYQAHRPENLYKRWAFWNLDYPYGAANVSRNDLID
ncbi:MAG: hypothetical protein SGARI_002055 [Bacillariaceae sp.]